MSNSPLIKIFFLAHVPPSHNSLFISFSNFPISKWGNLTRVLKATSSFNEFIKVTCLFRRWRFQFSNATTVFNGFHLDWLGMWVLPFFLIQSLHRVTEVRHYSRAVSTARVPVQHRPLCWVLYIDGLISSSQHRWEAYHSCFIRKEATFQRHSAPRRSPELANGGDRNGGIHNLAGRGTSYCPLPCAHDLHTSLIRDAFFGLLLWPFVSRYDFFVDYITIWMGKVHLLIVPCKIFGLCSSVQGCQVAHDASLCDPSFRIASLPPHLLSRSGFLP